MGKSNDSTKTKEDAKPVTPKIEIGIYLHLKGIKEWRKGGMIAFAQKKTKEKKLTTDEWNKLFEAY